jgi:hypothetical protein
MECSGCPHGKWKYRCAACTSTRASRKPT